MRIVIKPDYQNAVEIDPTVITSVEDLDRLIRALRIASTLVWPLGPEFDEVEVAEEESA